MPSDCCSHCFSAPNRVFLLAQVAYYVLMLRPILEEINKSRAIPLRLSSRCAIWRPGHAMSVGEPDFFEVVRAATAHFGAHSAACFRTPRTAAARSHLQRRLDDVVPVSADAPIAQEPMVRKIGAFIRTDLPQILSADRFQAAGDARIEDMREQPTNGGRRCAGQPWLIRRSPSCPSTELLHLFVYAWPQLTFRPSPHLAAPRVAAASSSLTVARRPVPPRRFSKGFQA